MLKFIKGLFASKPTVASIVASLDKVRADLAAHAIAKADERDDHKEAATVSAAKADAAHAEVLKAGEISANLGNLLGA